MTVQEDSVIGPYMQRLEEATRPLPADDRAELLAHVRDHIETHLGDPNEKGDAEKLQMLDQLGTPEEIARAALEEEPETTTELVSRKAPPSSGPAASSSQRASGRDWEGILTVTLLSVGGFLLVVGWFVGLVMLWRSPRWTTVQRLAGTTMVPGGLLLPAYVMTLSTEVSGPVIPPVVMLLVVQSALGTGYLAQSVSRGSGSGASTRTS